MRVGFQKKKKKKCIFLGVLYEINICKLRFASRRRRKRLEGEKKMKKKTRTFSGVL